MKKLFKIQMLWFLCMSSLLFGFELLSPDAELATVRSSMVDNGDGTYTISNPEGNSLPYAYLRVSQTGSSGDTIRDLVAGENLVVTLVLKSTSTSSYIQSSALNINNTYVDLADTWQVIEVPVTVDNLVDNRAFIRFALPHYLTDESLTIHMAKSSIDVPTPNNASNIISSDAALATVRSSMVDNGDGTYTISNPEGNISPYAYLRVSQTGASGDTIRDLVAGENLMVQLRVKSTIASSYVSSGALNIGNMYITSVDTWQDIVINVTVDNPVDNSAYIKFALPHYLTDESLTIDMNSVKILAETVIDPGPDDLQFIPEISQASIDEYLTAINNARAVARSCGDIRFTEAPPVVWNDDLYKASYEHSQDMTTNDFFAHEGSGTTSDWTAMAIAEFSESVVPSSLVDRVWYRRYDYAIVSENIAAGMETAQEAMDAWIASPGHCANIMNPSVAEVGMALSTARDTTQYTFYWTQVFGLQAAQD